MQSVSLLYSVFSFLQTEINVVCDFILVFLRLAVLDFFKMHNVADSF